MTLATTLKLAGSSIARNGAIIRPIQTNIQEAKDILKEYVSCAMNAQEESDLPVFGGPVLVSSAAIISLFDMTRHNRKCVTADEMGYVEFEYKDIDDDQEDAIIVKSKARDGSVLGILKFTSITAASNNMDIQVNVIETKVMGAHAHFDCDINGVVEHFEISCTRVCYILKALKVIHFDKARFQYNESADDAKVDLIDDNDKIHVRFTTDLAKDLVPQYKEEIITAYLMDSDYQVNKTYLKSVA